MNKYKWIEENMLNNYVRVYFHSEYNPSATLVMFGKLTHILADLDSIVLEPLPAGKLIKGTMLGVDSPAVVRLKDNIILSLLSESLIEDEKKEKKGK